jgi:hypothetical protein
MEDISPNNPGFPIPRLHASTSVILGGSGGFRLDDTRAARYLRLQSSAAATIIATLAAK